MRTMTFPSGHKNSVSNVNAKLQKNQVTHDNLPKDFGMVEMFILMITIPRCWGTIRIEDNLTKMLSILCPGFMFLDSSFQHCACLPLMLKTSVSETIEVFLNADI